MKQRIRGVSAAGVFAAAALAVVAAASARAGASEAPGVRVRVVLQSGGTLEGTLVGDDIQGYLLEIRPGMRMRLSRVDVKGIEPLPPAKTPPPPPPPTSPRKTPPTPPPPLSPPPSRPGSAPEAPGDSRAVLAAHAGALRALDAAKDQVQSWTADPGAAERLRAARAMREAVERALGSVPALPLPRKEREAYGKWLDALSKGFGETEALLAREAAGKPETPATIAEAARRSAARLAEADASAAAENLGLSLRTRLLDLGISLWALDRPIAPLLGWSAGLVHAAALDRLDAAYGAVEEAADLEGPVGPAHARACAEEVAAAAAEVRRTASRIGLAPAELALHLEYVGKNVEALGGLLDLLRAAAGRGAPVDAAAREAARAKFEERTAAFEVIREEDLDKLDARLEELGVPPEGSGTIFGLPGDNAAGPEEEGGDGGGGGEEPGGGDENPLGDVLSV